MIEILKKQWFVVLIAVIFISFAIYYVYDTNKGKLPGKTADGKDVVAEVNKKNITADDIYTNLNKSMGGSIAYMYFERAVADQAVKTTDAMEKDAAAKAKSYEEQVKSSYGDSEGEKYLQDGLKSIGYGKDDLEAYFLHYIKVDKLQEAYMDKHLEELFAPIYQEKNSRIVSHILIKMEDAQNPTEKELAKVKKVEDALANGDDFAKVAKKYSDDTGSKAKGGNLGYSDSDTNFVQEFKDKAFAMQKGEVSEWVKVTSTNYSGWHMIKVDETDMKKIMKDKDAKDGLYQAILNADSKLASKIVWEKSKDLKVTFKDKDLKKALLEYMGIEE